jgi:hypothetical protein
MEANTCFLKVQQRQINKHNHHANKRNDISGHKNHDPLFQDAHERDPLYVKRKLSTSQERNWPNG